MTDDVKQQTAAFITRDEFADAIDKIGGAIDRGFERVNRRIDEERQHHDDQVRKLAEKQADAGKVNPSVIIGVVGLAVGIVVSGISAVAYLSNITSKNNTRLEYVTEWRKTTELWAETNEMRDNQQDIGLARLGGYNDQLGIRLDGIDRRQSRLEDWYNGHVQELVGRIATVEEQARGSETRAREQERRAVENEKKIARLEALIEKTQP